MARVLQGFSHVKLDAHGFFGANGKSSWMTLAYGSPVQVIPRELWEELSLVVAGSYTNWLVVGDFNDVLSTDHKNDGAPFNLTRSSKFSETLDECRLIDLGSIDP